MVQPMLDRNAQKNGFCQTAMLFLHIRYARFGQRFSEICHPLLAVVWHRITAHMRAILRYDAKDKSREWRNFKVFPLLRAR
jgi:hypothetical protein